MAQDDQVADGKGEKVENAKTDELDKQEVEVAAADEAAQQEDNSNAGAGDPEQQLEAAQQELAQLREQVLRAKADSQNVQRRAERDVENAHKFGVEKLVQELLPVIDNLERGLEAPVSGNEAVDALREGVEMTLSLFIKALEKFQVVSVDPAGEPFDPNLHQAMSMVENDEVEANTVVAVMQKGYTLHGRLVRPAMVMVSKAKAPNTPKIDEQA